VEVDIPAASRAQRRPVINRQQGGRGKALSRVSGRTSRRPHGWGLDRLTEVVSTLLFQVSKQRQRCAFTAEKSSN